MNEKKEYKVLNPIAHSGRIERGEIVLLTEDEARNFPNNVELVMPVVATVEEPEKAIDDMGVRELRAKAKGLGLSTEGSKADLLERIALAEEADEEAGDDK
jgi:hypothetical protein